MSPTLTALISNSASMTKLLPDQRLLMALWLDAQLFGIPTDWTTLSNLPNGFKFLSNDEKLSIELFAIAQKLGLPTEGRALLAFIQQSTGNPSPQNSDLPYYLDNVWLKNCGAYGNIV